MATFAAEDTLSSHSSFTRAPSTNDHHYYHYYRAATRLLQFLLFGISYFSQGQDDG